MRTGVVIVCIASLAISISGLTDDERNNVETVHKECQSDPKTHVDEEIMKKLQKGEHVDKSIVGAHLLCMSTKFGFQNEDGKINKETLKKAFSRALSDQSKVDAAVEKCAVEKDDPQDTAIALGTCFRETAGVPGGAHHHHH